jgi:UDP-galactopyranose mutase
MAAAKSKKILIVGAGLSGCVFGRLAAESGSHVHIIDQRNHIGGNCYSYQDDDTGIEVHKYGPHIFHTNSSKVWKFVNRFSEFNNFRNKVKAIHNGNIYSMPVNLHTINQFFNKCFSPIEAEKFIASIRVKYEKYNNFEEYVLGSLGVDLYEAFFKEYTIKQWGVNPTDIPVSTARRLPIRFNYNDDYFNDTYQGIPINGYTKMFDNMINYKNITLDLGADFKNSYSDWKERYDLLVYTGSIDSYYNYTKGELPYRTVTFDKITGKDIQGNAVVNYTDNSVNYTRIHEHKWFTPEKKFTSSIGFIEYSSATTSKKNPFYPIVNKFTDLMMDKYRGMAKKEEKVLFVGRLAEYRYYNMDQAIASSMKAFYSWSNNA